MEKDIDQILSPITVENYAKGTSAKEEEAMYAQNNNAHEKFPNSIFIPIWKRGHLSWHSESSASVLALIMLFFPFSSYNYCINNFRLLSIEHVGNGNIKTSWTICYWSYRSRSGR